MKQSTVAAIICIAAVCYGTSLAQTIAPQSTPGTKTPLIDARQKEQKARIKQGVKSGELTRHETKRLAVEQKKIKRDEAKAKSDGKVTPQERKRLLHEQNRASKDIYKQKHDRQKRR